jgi:hypothetical protein
MLRRRGKRNSPPKTRESREVRERQSSWDQGNDGTGSSELAIHLPRADVVLSLETAATCFA